MGRTAIWGHTKGTIVHRGPIDTGYPEVGSREKPEAKEFAELSTDAHAVEAISDVRSGRLNRLIVLHLQSCEALGSGQGDGGRRAEKAVGPPAINNQP